MVHGGGPVKTRRKEGFKSSGVPGEKSKVKEALKRDVEQTKHDLTGGRKGQDLDQDVHETIKQAAGADPIPPENVPNPD
jgi:hypothetical protein